MMVVMAILVVVSGHGGSGGNRDGNYCKDADNSESGVVVADK